MRLALCLVVALCCGLPAASDGSARTDLSAVSSWAYWLQEPDLDSLADTEHDLVVIDYSLTGDADGEFSAADIQALRDSGKTVLAYLSIGEAEDYRFYWKTKWKPGKPGWLLEENPDWEGNYKVKYWAGGWWKKGLRPYLDRILDAGFDGVYLDLVDAYWWWHEEKGMKVRSTANRMCKLVERIANHGRDRAGEGFVVFTQNGVSILDDCSKKWRTRFLVAIDGVAVESLFHEVFSDEDQDYRLEKLAEFEDAGKLLLVVDYIGAAKWDGFFDDIDASGLGLLGYPAAPDHALDELVIYD